MLAPEYTFVKDASQNQIFSDSGVNPTETQTSENKGLKKQGTKMTRYRLRQTPSLRTPGNRPTQALASFWVVISQH